MTTIGNLLKLSRDAQSLAVANENLKLAKKKKITAKDLVKAGAKNIVGIELIKTQAQLSSGL